MKNTPYTEERSNHTTLKCCEWISANNRYPKNQSTDAFERKLGAWLNNRKSVKRGYARGIWFDSDDKIAEEHGYPNLFGRMRSRGAENSVQMTKTICEWIKENGRFPKSTSKNELERRYAAWVSGKKSKVEGNEAFLYPEEKAVISSYGLENLFVKKMVSQWLVNAQKLSKWLSEHNRIPLPIDDELEIYRIYKKAIKRHKLNNAELRIFESDGTMWIFDGKFRTIHEIKSNQLCEQICDFWQTYKRTPTQSDDPTLSAWLRRKKLASKNIKGGGVVYESDWDILRRRNMEFILRPIRSAKH